MISLDANAGSRLRPVAAKALQTLAADSQFLGNASSVHQAGRAAKKIIEDSRRGVLRFFGAPPNAKLIFTSGGTESCNQLILGFLDGRPPIHLICSTIEHPAILEPVRRLEKLGWQVSWVDPRQNGIVDPEDFGRMLRPDTALVALMAANNETGALQPVRQLAENLRGKKYQGLIVSDFSQALGKSRVNIEELFASGVDAIAFSGHKLGAAQGVGGIVCAGVPNGQICALPQFNPIMLGGPQENRLRAGTENVFAIATLGEVCRALLEDGGRENEQLRALREKLWTGIKTRAPGARRITPEASADDSPELALSNTLLCTFNGVRGDDLVVALDLEGVATSTGSACASGKQEPSHVLRAMGYADEDARSGLRLSLDWDATPETVANSIEILGRVLARFHTKGEAGFVRESGLGGSPKPVILGVTA